MICVCCAGVSSGSSCKQIHGCTGQCCRHTLSYMTVDWQWQASAVLCCCALLLWRCHASECTIQLVTNLETLPTDENADMGTSADMGTTAVDWVTMSFSVYTHRHHQNHFIPFASFLRFRYSFMSIFSLTNRTACRAAYQYFVHKGHTTRCTVVGPQLIYAIYTHTRATQPVAPWVHCGWIIALTGII